MLVVSGAWPVLIDEFVEHMYRCNLYPEKSYEMINLSVTLLYKMFLPDLLVTLI